MAAAVAGWRVIWVALRAAGETAAPAVGRVVIQLRVLLAEQEFLGKATTAAIELGSKEPVAVVPAAPETQMVLAAVGCLRLFQEQAPDTRVAVAAGRWRRFPAQTAEAAGAALAQAAPMPASAAPQTQAAVVAGREVRQLHSAVTAFPASLSFATGGLIR